MRKKTREYYFNLDLPNIIPTLLHTHYKTHSLSKNILHQKKIVYNLVTSNKNINFAHVS